MWLDCIPRLHGFDVKTPGLTSFCGRLYSQNVAQSTPATCRCLKHGRRWHHSGILSIQGISSGAYGRREILPVCITAGERGENSLCLPQQQCFRAMSLQLAVSVSRAVRFSVHPPARQAATACLMLFPSQEQTDVMFSGKLWSLWFVPASAQLAGVFAAEVCLQHVS